MYYVYFLVLSNSEIYTGLTDNLRRRISEHKRGKVKSTRHLNPFRFIGYEAFLLKSDATRREKFLKTTEGKRLFRQQYRDILTRVRPIIR
jgi:putative endonuclease